MAPLPGRRFLQEKYLVETTVLSRRHPENRYSLGSMWNAEYGFWEHQSGNEHVNTFNPYQQCNSYPDYHQQYQQPAYQMPYQPPSYQEPYFTSQQHHSPAYQYSYSPPEEYYTPQAQQQPEISMDELRALFQQSSEQHAQFMERSDRQREELEKTLEEFKKTMDNQFAPPVVFDSNIRVEDVDVEFVDEDDDDAHDELIDLMCMAISDEGLNQEQRKSLIELLQANETPIPETENLKPEPQAVENMHDEITSESNTHGISLTVPHYDLVEVLDNSIGVEDGDEGMIEGESEEIDEKETPEKLSKNRPVFNKTDRFCSSKQDSMKIDCLNRSVWSQADRFYPETAPIHEKSIFEPISKEQEQPIEIKLPYPSHQKSAHQQTSIEELFLMQQNENTLGQVLDSNPVWGKNKNFELTGEGEYGENMMSVVGDEAKVDPAAMGHVCRWSHNGLRDQICCAYNCSSSRSCNRLDYDDPGD